MSDDTLEQRATKSYETFLYECPSSAGLHVYQQGYIAGATEERKWWADRIWAVYQSGVGQHIAYATLARQGGRRAWQEVVHRANEILQGEPK